MKHTKRAIRRSQKLRMKQRARRLYGFPGSEKYADNRTVCSCFMCGHKRKNLGPNIQELRAGIAA